jgi:hypothetical protein
MTFALLSEVYGMGWVDLNEMPMAALMIYMENVPRMLALRKVIAGEGAAMAGQPDGERMLREWNEAFLGETEAVKATPGMLMMMGIGVKHAS